MPDWNSGLPDATAAERLAASLLLRLSDGSAKECPTTDFLQKQASGSMELDGSGVVQVKVNSGTNSSFRGFAIGQGTGGAVYGAIRMELSLGEMRYESGFAGFGGFKTFYTNGAERVRIDVGGNVGIGTIPTTFGGYTSLHLRGPSSAILLVDGGGTDIAEVNSSTTNGVIFGSRTNSPVNFSINTFPILRLDTTGNFRPIADNARSLGLAANRWTVVYAATGTINTSDARAKHDIGAIPEAWLDAWTDVQWQRFKFVDGTRWHLGLIAQDVHAAFAAHGLDAFEIGLCCYDAWEEQREPVTDAEGNPTGETRVVQDAGDRWGLRYDECQAIEAAWQRRRIAQLEARLAQLEAA